MNKRRTFTLSKADDFPNPVLSPNKMIPSPGWNITGLILFEYNESLCSLLGFYANLTALRIAPLELPAGENQGNCVRSFLAQVPAMSPFSGT